MESRTAAEAVVLELEARGVSTVFMLPGEENLAVVSALANTEIERVVCRHEQHAAFMAVAHARLTGDPGVCLATLGPGALNLFTGLAQAQLMGAPVLALTGQKPLRANLEGPFQMLDIVAAARPLVVHAERVADPEMAALTVRDGLARARAGGGAVLIELPEDVAKAPAGDNARAPIPHERPVAPARAIRGLGDVISAANRPLLLVGSAATAPETSAALRRLCERTGLSAIATQMGKGAVSERHPRSLRALGMHRPDYVHAALRRADLIVTVGYQPVEHPPSAWHERDQQLAHVHRFPARIARDYSPDVEIVGDIAHTLDGLCDLEVDTGWSDALRRAIDACLAEELGAIDDPTAVATAVRVIAETVPDDASIALDNGLYKLWFARHHATTSPHGLLLDNALATMGAGLATGMEAARLGYRAVVVTGDGGFAMNLGDLETAARLELDLTIVVLRDDEYGFIAWHQDEQDRDRTDVGVANPDLVALARAFGAAASRTAGVADLEAALRDAARRPGLSVIDCPVNYRCNALLEGDDGRPERVDEKLGASAAEGL